MNFRATNPISRRALLPLIAIAALSPVLLVPSAARAQGADWQIYRREDLGFEIAMPGEPEVTVETGERGDPWVRAISAEVDVDQLHFGISYTEFAEPMSIAQLSAAQRAGAGHLGVDALRETAIKMNGFPGLDLVGESDAFSIIMRIVVREKQTISAAVTGTGNISADPSVRRFLDSFKLLP